MRAKRLRDIDAKEASTTTRSKRTQNGVWFLARLEKRRHRFQHELPRLHAASRKRIKFCRLRTRDVHIVIKLLAPAQIIFGYLKLLSLYVGHSEAAHTIMIVYTQFQFKPNRKRKKKRKTETQDSGGAFVMLDWLS